MAYPELVSRGVSERRKCNWLVRVGASNGVTPMIKKIMVGGGGFRATRTPPWIHHCASRYSEQGACKTFCMVID